MTPAATEDRKPDGPSPGAEPSEDPELRRTTFWIVLVIFCLGLALAATLDPGERPMQPWVKPIAVLFFWFVCFTFIPGPHQRPPVPKGGIPDASAGPPVPPTVPRHSRAERGRVAAFHAVALAALIALDAPILISLGLAYMLVASVVVAVSTRAALRVDARNAWKPGEVEWF